MKLISNWRGMLAALCLIPLMAACASAGGSQAPRTGSTTAARPVVRQPVTRPPRDVQFNMMPGLEGVIGVTGPDLTRQFGPARLDVWEGDARKLQFSGEACVLDIYLYPTSQAREPLAAYVDARRASDGKDVDRAACVRALRGR